MSVTTDPSSSTVTPRNKFLFPCVAGCLALVLLSIALVFGGVAYIRSLPHGFIVYGDKAELAAKEGMGIAAAIEAYDAAEGTLPKDLADLAPRFLPTVPGSTWEYGQSAGEFSLRYYLGRGGVEYSSADREWLLNYEGSRSLMFKQP